LIRRRIVRIILTVWAFLTVAISITFMWVGWEVQQPQSTATAPFAFDVRWGDTMSTVATELHRHGYLHNPMLFELYARVLGIEFSEPLQGGQYFLTPHMSIRDMLAALTDDDSAVPVPKEPKSFASGDPGSREFWSLRRTMKSLRAIGKVTRLSGFDSVWSECETDGGGETTGWTEPWVFARFFPPVSQGHAVRKVDALFGAEGWHRSTAAEETRIPLPDKDLLVWTRRNEVIELSPPETPDRFGILWALARPKPPVARGCFVP